MLSITDSFIRNCAIIYFQMYSLRYLPKSCSAYMLQMYERTPMLQSNLSVGIVLLIGCAFAEYFSEEHLGGTASVRYFVFKYYQSVKL